jgi:hypothetical protein
MESQQHVNSPVTLFCDDFEFRLCHLQARRVNLDCAETASYMLRVSDVELKCS